MARRLVEAIERELRARGEPLRAAGAKRYLKSDLEFLGVATPAFRAAVGAALLADGPLAADELLAAVAELWQRPVFELRAAAVEMLDRHPRLLAPGDLATVAAMLRGAGTWALVDWLATRVAGPLLERHPETAEALDAWAADGDFWMRRAALLALLAPLRRGGGDFARFAAYADTMLEEREFFIRKAIGWVLREVGKKRPELVEQWLAPRLGRVSGLTLREAVKYLPPEHRAALLAGPRPLRPVRPETNGGRARRRR